MTKVCRMGRCHFAALAGLLGLAAGCNETLDTYPESMRYPPRTDLLVKDIPKTQPTRFNHPGRLPLDLLARLPMRYDVDQKGRVVDMAKVDQQLKDGTLNLDENDKALLEEVRAGNILDPRNLAEPEQAAIDEMLRKVFGTPAEPTVKDKNREPLGVAPEVVEALKLDFPTLQDGSRHYRQHCLHCHGLEGNGKGPTGAWVSPHPRDFRQGVFKFTSSSQDLGVRKPRRDDLLHVMVHGIEGASMPSFNVYPRQDLEKTASYIIHLSLRGELEYYLIKDWLTQGSARLPLPPTPQEVEQIRSAMTADKKPAEEISKLIEELTKAPTAEQIKEAQDQLRAKFTEAIEVFAARWVEAQNSAIQPDPYPYPDTEEALLQSAARGSQLFNTGTASCVSCHKNYGREAPYYFDAWGTVVRPRNLIEGHMRGGRRPIDLYYRVFSGINGAGMASYANELRPNDQDKAAGQDKIWDLVNFMRVLPYPDLRAKLRQPPFNIPLD
jgi:mono/diheme cytochrome c family protein